MQFLLDTGATCSLIGLDGYKSIGSPRLKPTNTQLRSYGQVNVPLKGWTMVDVQIGNVTRTLRIFVADATLGSNLFGATWFNAFGIKILSPNNNVPEEFLNAIEPVQPIEERERMVKVNELCRRYPTLFSNGLGLCTSFKAHLLL